MTIEKRETKVIIAEMFVIMFGFLNLLFIKNTNIHIVYVMLTSIVLIYSVFANKKDIIRPYSFLIMSFFVFVWMRYILNIFRGTAIISIGKGITVENVNRVAIYLGNAICVMGIINIITHNILINGETTLFQEERHITIPICFQWLLLFGAICFFGLFLRDSILKISLVNAHDYFAINEGILLVGYRYFSLGKYCILLWAIFSKNKNRFFIASTILALASIGYLMRGARGYAIMYFLMWLQFLALKIRIRLVAIAMTGIGLIYLANAVLSYRLGWQIASGFWNIIESTLFSQGSSVEPVFGAVVFRDMIHREFGVLELFTRYDFGIVVDRVRETGFTQGGFGSSFFAEAYFSGTGLCLFFLVMAGICSGLLDNAYNVIKRQNGSAIYPQILLLMTLPNLIYLGRSSLKDFIIKTMTSLLLILILETVSKNYMLTLSNAGEEPIKSEKRRLRRFNIKLR